MSAKDYSVTFGYGEWDGYYYTAAKPHRGNDRPCPTGTPIYIGNTIIGLTGATGMVSGAHLHTQAGNDEWCQNTFNPTSLEFQPGTVVHAGTASQWGNYIIIKCGSNYICYAHLSAIYVSVGQVINVTGENSVDLIKSMYWRLLGREADQDGINHYLDQANKVGWDGVYTDLKNSAEGQADWDRRNPARVTELEAHSRELTQVKAQLAEALKKSPDVTIKEVEKIIEVPVIDADTKAKINENNSLLKSLAALFNKIFNTGK